MRTAGVLMELSVFGGLPWGYFVVIYGHAWLVIPVLLVMYLAGTGASAALKRNHYTVALGGAICSLLLLPIFGIPALILVVKRRKEFEQELEEEKEDADLSSWLWLLLLRGRFGQAIGEYPRPTELEPKTALAYYHRGLAYREKGEVAKAVSDLEKCIALSSDGELTKVAQQVLSKIKKSH